MMPGGPGDPDLFGDDLGPGARVAILVLVVVFWGLIFWGVYSIGKAKGLDRR